MEQLTKKYNEFKELKEKGSEAEKLKREMRKEFIQHYEGMYVECMQNIANVKNVEEIIKMIEENKRVIEETMCWRVYLVRNEKLVRD